MGLSLLAVCLPGFQYTAERVPINFQRLSIENLKHEVWGLAPSLERREMIECLRL